MKHYLIFIFAIALLVSRTPLSRAESSISGDIENDEQHEESEVARVAVAPEEENSISGLSADSNQCANSLMSYVTGFNKFAVAKSYCAKESRDTLICGTDLMSYVSGFDKYRVAISNCKNTTPEQIACAKDLMGLVSGFDKFKVARDYCVKYPAKILSCAKGIDLGTVTGVDKFAVSIESCTNKLANH